MGGKSDERQQTAVQTSRNPNNCDAATVTQSADQRKTTKHLPLFREAIQRALAQLSQEEGRRAIVRNKAQETRRRERKLEAEREAKLKMIRDREKAALSSFPRAESIPQAVEWLLKNHLLPFADFVDREGFRNKHLNHWQVYDVLMKYHKM